MTATLLAHRPLSAQSQQILRAMIEGGGIDKRDAMQLSPPCWNLPGRIFDIRESYGADSVETVEVPNANGGTRARYVWRGTGDTQQELFNAR